MASDTVIGRTVYDATHGNTVLLVKGKGVTRSFDVDELPPDLVVITEAHYKMLLDYLEWRLPAKKVP